MGKLVFKVPKNEETDYGIPMRIRKSKWLLVEDVARKTGLKKVEVLERMIVYAYENTVIEIENTEREE